MEENWKKEKSAPVHRIRRHHICVRSICRKDHLLMAFQKKNIKDAEWAKEKGTQAAGVAKDIFKQMLQIIKKPVSKTEEMALNNSRSEGLRLIITKAVLFVIIVCIIP